MQTSPRGHRVRILHLEDNEADRLLVAEMLEADGLPCEFVVATSRNEFADALQRGAYDLILSDFTLPSYDGANALRLAHQLCPGVPFVFFSGTIGEEIAVDSLKNGAVDYVLKQRPHRLIPAIRRALNNAEEHAHLRQAEEKIREQVDLLDKARDAILVCDMDSRITFWNQSAERIYEWNSTEAMGKDVRQLFKESIPQLEDADTVKSLAEHGEWTGEKEHLTKSGKIVVVQSRCTLIRDKQGRPKSKLILNTDITERKQLEEQFLRAQRLESLGVLASGIAHDLNNALSPIVMGIGILREKSLSRELESILNTMETSARRGADMVKQILAFARGGGKQKVLIHVDQLVKEMGEIISDTFSRNINCCVDVDKQSWSVFGLPTQLHQVLMNLCVNARDAMPDGGTLTLATKNIHLDALEAAQHPDAKPGNYVCISATDTGTGIPTEQIKKIFDPFFTTKEIGKGTGLGLSTSLTIIKNHGGFMTVQSQLGRGAEFKCYLPAVTATSLTETITPKPLLAIGNGECILVVDDEEVILAITRTALENYGYRVLTASSGPEAVVHLAERGNDVSLVITDLVMPFMDGYATIHALRRIVPDIKIIISSGLEREKTDKTDHEAKIDARIQKPFTTENLLTTVHEVLMQKK